MTHDAVTRCADDLTSSFINLEKEITDRRRLDDRRTNSRRSDDPDSARQFKQEVEREYRAEIRQLREENDHKDLKIERLEARLIAIESRFDGYREANEPTLNAASVIVNAGIVFKYMIIVIIGLTSAIGGIAVVMETIKQWSSK